MKTASRNNLEQDLRNKCRNVLPVILTIFSLMQLTTDRLFLRPILASDVAAVYAYRSDAEANRYQSSVHLTERDTTDFIHGCASEFGIEGTWFQLAIVSRTTGKVIGDLGLHTIAGERAAVELGITLDRRNWGRGYAHESITGLLTLLFEKHGILRVVARIDARNSRVVRLLERLGFAPEPLPETPSKNQVCATEEMLYSLSHQEFQPAKHLR